MSTTKLILRSNPGCTTKDGESLIFVRYCHQRKQTVLSTGEKVPVKSWDQTREEVRKSHRGFSALNSYLKSVKERIDNIAREAKFRNIEPSAAYVREKFTAGAKASDIPDFMPFFLQFIEESKAEKKPATVKTYVTTLHHLQNYQKKRKVSLNWDSIDMTFYTGFKRFQMVDLNLTRNAFGKNIRVIKAVMNVALERRYHSNHEFKSRGFVALEETADTIYLTEKELQKMLDLDLSSRPRLERLRDLFYVGAYTGLRFSDFNQIKMSNVEGNFFKITTEKGGQKVTIPIHPNVVQIMHKYEGVLPTTTNQELNRCLKDIGLLTGLTDTVTVTRMKASGKEETTYKKYERITTHTARRSFATNLVLSGFGSLTVMRITGHRTEKAFLKYIRTTNEQAAVLLEKHWQENGAHLKVA